MRLRAMAMALGLAGCALLEPDSGAVDAIVAEAVVAARAPGGEQVAALGRAQKQAVSSGAPVDRLRLATMLATLPAPLRDDARALELLKPIADAGAPGVGRFAALLAAQVAERQRLTHDLRERDRLDKERDKREEALRQQLDALRAVERGIIEREDKLRKKPR